MTLPLRSGCTLRTRRRYPAYHSANLQAGRTVSNTEPSLSASLWRFKWYILAAAILAAAIGYGVSMLQDKLYEAEGQLLLNDPRTSGGIAAEIGIVLDPNRYVRNQAEVMESPQVSGASFGAARRKS